MIPPPRGVERPENALPAPGAASTPSVARRRRTLAFLLAGLALWRHWPAGAAFKADDYPALAHASAWRNVAADFAQPWYGIDIFHFYRPLITVSLAVDHLLFGLDPLGYYVMNVLATIASALLLLAIVRRLVPGPGGDVVALATATLWLCHPIVVTAQRCWAVGRVDTHTVPLFLLAVLLHLRARRGGARWPVWLAALGAFGSKELSVGLPFVLLAVDRLDPQASARGRWPALPFLLLLPPYFVLRRLALGEWVGGYHAAPPTSPLVLGEGLLHNLGENLVPGATPPWSWLLALVPLGAVAAWIAASRAARNDRLLAVLLLSFGLFAPLVPLLPGMRGSINQRTAYLACTAVLAAWCAAAVTLPRLRPWLRAALALLPAAWLLPASFAESRRMDEHDAFCRSLVGAMRACATRLGAGEPIVLGGAPVHATRPFRLFWGLSAAVKPPFTDRAYPVVTLFGADRGPDALATAICDSVTAWVEVTPSGGVVVEGTARPRRRVPPDGFDGVLRLDLTNRLPAPLGYAVGPDYDGWVAVCTSHHTLCVEVPARAGRIRLDELLTRTAAWPAYGSTHPVVDLLFAPTNTDPENPVLLHWLEADKLCVAELTVERHWARDYMRQRLGR